MGWASYKEAILERLDDFESRFRVIDAEYPKDSNTSENELRLWASRALLYARSAAKAISVIRRGIEEMSDLATDPSVDLALSNQVLLTENVGLRDKIKALHAEIEQQRVEKQHLKQAKKSLSTERDVFKSRAEKVEGNGRSRRRT